MQLTVHMGPLSTFCLSDWLQGHEGDPVTEVVIISQATGEKQCILGLDKAQEAYKGTLSLSLSAEKELTTDPAKAVRVVGPTADLFVSTIPGAKPSVSVAEEPITEEPK